MRSKNINNPLKRKRPPNGRLNDDDVCVSVVMCVNPKGFPSFPRNKKSVVNSKSFPHKKTKTRDRFCYSAQIPTSEFYILTFPPDTDQLYLLIEPMDAILNSDKLNDTLYLSFFFTFPICLILVAMSAPLSP